MVAAIQFSRDLLAGMTKLLEAYKEMYFEWKNHLHLIIFNFLKTESSACYTNERIKETVIILSKVGDLIWILIDQLPILWSTTSSESVINSHSG